MFTLMITGFRTQAEVDAFISWYEGQGEQDAAVWFEYRQKEGEVECCSMDTDLSKEHWPPKHDGDATIIKVIPIP
jgi:hypothetical protein